MASEEVRLEDVEILEVAEGRVQSRITECHGQSLEFLQRCMTDEPNAAMTPRGLCAPGGSHRLYAIVKLSAMRVLEASPSEAVVLLGTKLGDLHGAQPDQFLNLVTQNGETRFVVETAAGKVVAVDRQNNQYPVVVPITPPLLGGLRARWKDRQGAAAPSAASADPDCRPPGAVSMLDAVSCVMLSSGKVDPCIGAVAAEWQRLLTDVLDPPAPSFDRHGLICSSQFNTNFMVTSAAAMRALQLQTASVLLGDKNNPGGLFAGGMRDEQPADFKLFTSGSQPRLLQVEGDRVYSTTKGGQKYRVVVLVSREVLKMAKAHAYGDTSPGAQGVQEGSAPDQQQQGAAAQESVSGVENLGFVPASSGS